MNGENGNHTRERKYENLGEMTELLTGEDRICLARDFCNWTGKDIAEGYGTG